MASVSVQMQFEWEPFKVNGQHFAFDRDKNSRLSRLACSHWGPVVYRWEGAIDSGPNTGKTGVLIGETNNLRQRIKQYVAGTQARGNKLWREEFLTRGAIYLYVLALKSLSLEANGSATVVAPSSAFSSSNMRVLMEQSLVQSQIQLKDPSIWLVNRRQ